MGLTCRLFRTKYIRFLLLIAANQFFHSTNGCSADSPSFLKRLCGPIFRCRAAIGKLTPGRLISNNRRKGRMDDEPLPQRSQFKKRSAHPRNEGVIVQKIEVVARKTVDIQRPLSSETDEPFSTESSSIAAEHGTPHLRNNMPPW